MVAHKRQTVLIVDDKEINRGILKYILADHYDTLEAENGREALDILKDGRAAVNAILLDVIMPEMDGYGFLNAIKGTEFVDLPVIVLTGSTDIEEENRALQLGAWDFIPKPYQATILLSRLRNAIARSQIGLFEQMKRMAEFDGLTGLYNRNKFYSETREMLDSNPETEFAMVRIDIDQFSLLNAFWGERGGDEFLKDIANNIRERAAGIDTCTFGRINADIFCMCVPNKENLLSKEIEDAKVGILASNTDYYTKPSFGIYVISDRSMPVEAMYECASMAAKVCKGKYDTFVGYYDESMRKETYREQTIINEMQAALDEGQFVPYFQPKFNLKTNRPYGAEALARWMHPEKGLISPGLFIPVFERNGFISKLDYCMWEQVCRYLKRWREDGLDPAPVSVNISRANMYNPNIVDILVSLVRKYNIPASLLNLELTESAYMDNPDATRTAVKRLQENGFTIMMDDFGSGYSSLNTLKDISVDVLKIDMKFLSGSDTNGRSERILSSMIHMAGWLDIPVIVEGVELKEQVSFLKSVGCGYVQGYYFAKPMPVDKYIDMITADSSLPDEERVSSDLKILNETIWSSDRHLEFLFDHIDQLLAAYEYDGIDCYPLRVNQRFNEVFGYGENALCHNKKVSAVFDDDSHSEIIALFDSVCDSKASHQCICKLKDINGQKHKMQLILNYLGSVENRRILFAMFVEIGEAAGT